MKPTNEALVDEGFQAITGSSRALGNGVDLADVGSLLWVVLRQMVPCDTMALFVPDRARHCVAIRFAAGSHGDLLQGLTRHVTSGIAGWVTLHHRAVLNAAPVFDLGFRSCVAPALRSSVVVPLLNHGTVIAVLALYSKDLLAFTGAQATLLELLGPRLALSIAEAARVQIEPIVESGPTPRLILRAS